VHLHCRTIVFHHVLNHGAKGNRFGPLSWHRQEEPIWQGLPLTPANLDPPSYIPERPCLFPLLTKSWAFPSTTAFPLLSSYRASSLTGITASYGFRQIAWGGREQLHLIHHAGLTIEITKYQTWKMKTKIGKKKHYYLCMARH